MLFGNISVDAARRNKSDAKNILEYFAQLSFARRN
jgi:hypothetical protein